MVCLLLLPRQYQGCLWECRQDFMVESLGTRPFLQTVMNYLQRTGKYFLNSLRAWLPSRQNIQKPNEPLFTWHFIVPSGWGAVCMDSFSQEPRTVAFFFEFLFILQQLKPSKQQLMRVSETLDCLEEAVWFHRPPESRSPVCEWRLQFLRGAHPIQENPGSILPCGTARGIARET